MAPKLQIPEWLVKDYMERRTPYEEAAIGLQTGLKNYMDIDEMKRRNITQQREWDQREQMLGIQKQNLGLKQAEMGYDPNNPQAFWDRFNADRQRAGALQESQTQENLAKADYYRNGGFRNQNGNTPPVKAPSGYRPTPEGNLEPIPGGPAETKLKEKQAKEKADSDAQAEEARRIVEKIDSALGKISATSAGGMAATKDIPFIGQMTGATDLGTDLESIQSSLGLQKLMEMKSKGKNGSSGLGALSEKEMALLVSNIKNLKQRQSPEQLKANLEYIKSKFGGGSTGPHGATVVQGGITYTWNPATGQYE